MNENILKFTAKDTVFRNLFGTKKYLARLFSALHKGEQIDEDDIKIITLEQIVMASLYNDVGFMVNGMLIILIECQSTWSENIIIRFLMYLAETYYKYYRDNKKSLYSSTKVDFPKPELYLIYTGNKKITKKYISLSESFLDGKKCDLDIRVRVITQSKKGDIISQYLRFTKILAEQVKKYGRTRKAAVETIRICTNEDVLKEYMQERKSEVESIMLNMFDVESEFNIFFENERQIAIAEGEAKGRAEGEADGKHKKAVDVAKKLLKGNFSAEDTANYSGLSLNEVLALKDSFLQTV